MYFGAKAHPTVIWGVCPGARTVVIELDGAAIYAPLWRGGHASASGTKWFPRSRVPPRRGDCELAGGLTPNRRPRQTLPPFQK